MHIAILTGGISTERAVALRSAKNMKDWIGISGNTADFFDFPEEIDVFLECYKSYDYIIPIFHGRYGEDGIITGMCETLGLRVTGCPSTVHALCIDKFHTNCVVEKIGIKIPKSWIPGLPKPQKLLPEIGETKLNQALIIKPNQGGSSLATNKVHTLEEFENGILAVNEVIESLTQERIELLGKSSGDFVRHFPSLYDVPLVQECIEGREFTVGVYREQGEYQALPIMEMFNASGIHGFQEKYETDGSNEVFDTVESELIERLKKESIQIAKFLGTRGIIRIDWRYNGRDIYFLEVNTIPGFTNASFIPKMWKKAGKTEKEFVEMLCFEEK